MAGARTFGILLPKIEKENVAEEEVVKVEEVEEKNPKRQKMDVPSCSKGSRSQEKVPSENRLAAMVAEENMALQKINDELVELRKIFQKMLKERKKNSQEMLKFTLKKSSPC